MAIFTRDVAQKVLWIWILDAPLLCLRRALLQQLVERLLGFGTNVLCEIAQVNAAYVRRSALLGDGEVERDALADGFEAATKISEIDLQ